MSDLTTAPDPFAELSLAELAAVQLADRLRAEGLEPLLDELRLSEGDTHLAHAALGLLHELDGEVLVGLALDAAARLSP